MGSRDDSVVKNICLPFERCVWFPGPTPERSELPVTPALRGTWPLFWPQWEPTHTCVDTHTSPPLVGLESTEHVPSLFLTSNHLLHAPDHPVSLPHKHL